MGSGFLPQISCKRLILGCYGLKRCLLVRAGKHPDTEHLRIFSLKFQKFVFSVWLLRVLSFCHFHQFWHRIGFLPRKVRRVKVTVKSLS